MYMHLDVYMHSVYMYVYVYIYMYSIIYIYMCMYLSVYIYACLQNKHLVFFEYPKSSLTHPDLLPAGGWKGTEEARATLDDHKKRSPLLFVFVWGLVGTTESAEVKVLQARSVKILSEVAVDPGLCPHLLRKIGEQRPVQLADPASSEGTVPTASMPKSGPSKQWLDQHGRTPGCHACSQPKLHGRVHNKQCKIGTFATVGGPLFGNTQGNLQAAG